MVGIIYKYTSPSGKFYIGQTTQEKRRRKTFMNLNKSYGGDKIDSARKKYGPQNFEYEILFRLTFSSKQEATDKLDELEEFYITYYDSYRNGYNMTFGGYTNRGFTYSEEQKAEMSRRMTGRRIRPRTDEEKAYHSSIMRRHWASKEYRELRARINADPQHRLIASESHKGMRNGMYGKTHSKEARIKMSESRFGEKNIWYGREKSEAYRQKIRESLLGYRRSNPVQEETKAKISQSISVAVRQYTLNNDFIAEFQSVTQAGACMGIDPSGITKCCKGKRKSIGGYIWRYAEEPTFSEISRDTIDPEEWIDVAEAVRLTGRNRNVIYYHIKVHKLPSLKNGRKRKISKSSLLSILK